jgi:hypothetical protein
MFSQSCFPVIHFFFDREEEKQNSEEDITISAIRNDMWRLI